MVMRAILFASLATSLILTAASAAEITDLRARLDGDAGQIWIALDGQPTGLTSEVTATGLDLTLNGVSLRARAITPASDQLVAAVTVDPAGDGGVVRLYASRGWMGARAELRQGGVLVSMMVGPERDVSIASGAHGSAPVAGPPVFETTQDTAAVGNDVVAPAAASGADSPGQPPQISSPPSASPPTFFAEDDSTARSGSAVVPPGVCSDEAQAVADSPWDDELLHAQAACLSDGGHLAASASIYEQMLAFDPENFQATVALAEIRIEEGNARAARELYNRAASHAISDAEAARARSRLRSLRDQ